MHEIKARLTHQNLKLIKGHFTTISGHLSANHLNIFQKTEIQTVILRCLISLKLIGTNIMTQNVRTQKTQMSLFFTKSQKKEMEIFALCVIILN